MWRGSGAAIACGDMPLAETARTATSGATLRTLRTPDRAGHVADITLGHDDAASDVLRRDAGADRSGAPPAAVDMDARSDPASILDPTNHVLFSLAGEGSPGGLGAHRLHPAFGSARVDLAHPNHHMVLRVSTAR